MIVKPLKRQSLFDVCLQHTGSVDTLFEIMKTNGFNSLNPDLGQGVELAATTSKRVKDFYTLSGITVATMPLMNDQTDFNHPDFNTNDFL